MLKPKVAVAAGPTVVPSVVRSPSVAVGSGARSLDKVIHERLRLGIVSALSVNETLTFKDLKKILATTDGNLSVHSRKLEEAGYIECTKGFEGRVPRTEYRLTEKGRTAMSGYLEHMEALIRATRGQ